MAIGSHDASFAEFVSAERSRLLGAAFLMFGTQRRAEDVVQSALAYLYGAWPGRSDALTKALYQILHTTPGRLVLPWQRGERIELVDTSADRPLLPPGIVTDLADLPVEDRRVLILERYVQLPSVQIAALMGADVATVHLLSSAARAALVARDASRADDQVLADQLRAALPYPADAADAGAEDLAHGRLLVRRRLLRAGALVTALLLAVVVGTWQLVPLVRPDREAAGPPVVTPTPTCDVRQSTCRTTLVREWRNQMSQITGSYVDPERTYFSGYTFSYDDRYDSRGFWSGDGGALGLDMYRLSEGSTEVFVQIATSREFAIPCGQVTHEKCNAMRFMDGNVFTLSESSLLSQGLEVQYSPKGEQVITVVARNTTRGKTLDVSRADLMALITDDRLQLPPL